MKMKTLTNHNMRITRMQKHNDRNFNSTNDKHIDTELSKNNAYWSVYNNMSFEETEKLYYSINYGKALKKQNEKYEAKRQYARCKTIDDMLTSPNTAPMESLFYIGNHEDSANSKEIMKVFNSYVKWLRKEFGQNFHILDLALHLDEPNSAPHIHMRSIIDYVDNDGLRKIGQDRGLEALGFELPNPEAKKGKNNNRRMSFDKVCREKLISICAMHNIEIVAGEGRSGQTLEDHKARKEAEKQAEALEAELKMLYAKIDEAEQDEEILREVREAEQLEAELKLKQTTARIREAERRAEKAEATAERYELRRSQAMHEMMTEENALREIRKEKELLQPIFSDDEEIKHEKGGIDAHIRNFYDGR